MADFKLKPGFVQPNKIFLWVGYGNVDVYLIDTEEKYYALQKEVYEVCKVVDPDSFPMMGIMKMIERFGGIGCHESFEHGTGFAILK